MNDTDYIKAGVELAEGWEPCLYEGTGEMYAAEVFDIGDQVYPEEQHHKDALAAQLIRQVDAISTDKLYFQSDTEDVTVHTGEEFVSPVIVAGPDRSMNSIRAIVDSGVLKSGVAG